MHLLPLSVCGPSRIEGKHHMIPGCVRRLAILRAVIPGRGRAPGEASVVTITGPGPHEPLVVCGIATHPFGMTALMVLGSRSPTPRRLSSPPIWRLARTPAMCSRATTGICRTITLIPRGGPALCIMPVCSMARRRMNCTGSSPPRRENVRRGTSLSATGFNLMRGTPLHRPQGPRRCRLTEGAHAVVTFLS